MKYTDNNHQFKISLPRREMALPYRVITREKMKTVLDGTYPDSKVAVSGGWGYSKDDMTVIECDNEEDGVAMEYRYIEYRTKEELIVFMPKGERFYDIHTKLDVQYLLDVDGVKCDKLVFNVDAIPESELMQGEDHRIDNSRRIHYKSVAYFDISRFYGNRKGQCRCD